MKNSSYSLLLTLSLAGFYSQAQPLNDLKKRLDTEVSKRPALAQEAFASKPLTRQEASEAARLLLADRRKQRAPDLEAAWQAKSFKQGSHVLKFEYNVFGDKPKDGRSLFISMHGGGNTEPAVNDQQWKNQIGLYKPAEGVYVAPRAPTNTWNLWHESPIDSLFDDLIQAAVLVEGVSPDKVYIMGYSAGGDGVYQLAPRMADHWAAAAMMAGHPNEVTPVNLRNIGFTLHVGALDNGFNRNTIARRWSVLLDSLEKADPGGYRHFVQLHEGRSHWMKREDTVAVDWMMKFRRNPIPTKVVWKQDDVHHRSFYWLAVPEAGAKTGGDIIASYQGNDISIETNYSDTLFMRLNDNMMDLDKPVRVTYAGKLIFCGKVTRNSATLAKTVADRNDPGLVFSAELVLVNGKVSPATKARRSSTK